jgi:hypothetical protein
MQISLRKIVENLRNAQQQAQELIEKASDLTENTVKIQKTSTIGTSKA